MSAPTTPSMPAMPTVADIKANTLYLMRRAGAPVTHANLQRMAAKYEAAYVRSRDSKRPPIRAHLMGQLLTARAFYSLAREAPEATA